MTDVDIRLRRAGPETYLTADGRYKVVRDFWVTGCDCPEQLCKHEDHERNEYGWFIFPNTEAGERMGLPDSLGGGDTLREARQDLARIYRETA